jgi:ABC-type sugar transport system ATPase subunit
MNRRHPSTARSCANSTESLPNCATTIIYVSHFLDDVISLADDVTILRGGQVVGQVKAAETTADELLTSMLGQRLESVFPHRPRGNKGAAQTVLEVRGLSQSKRLRDITFDIKQGEVVGLAGLVGSGRTEVARSIFGIDKYDAGTVAVAGNPLKWGGS